MRSLLILALCGVTGLTCAQDIALSQPYFAPLMLSPALAGGAKVPRINILYRNQWPRLDAGFRNVYFSYDQYSETVHGGIGGYYHQWRDTNGITNYGTYGSANFSLISGGGEIRLVAGLEAGYVHGTLKFSEYNNAPQGLYKSDIDYLDLGAGLAVHSRRYSVIAGVQHLNYPVVGFNTDFSYRLPAKLTIGATALIPLGGRYGESDVSPLVFYTLQGDTQTLMLGFMYQRNHILFSTAYRNRESWNLTLGVMFDRLRLVYTFDIPVSSVALRRPGGAHEVGFMLFLKPQERNRWKPFPSLEYNGYYNSDNPQGRSGGY